ncbi:MAG: hypothetical protein LBQ06_01150, partial [Frankiaceae bacterium]|nr:hypothetical protein [Frankiaceae bacterium]
TSPIAFEVNASTSTLDLTHYQPDTTVKNVQAAPNSGSGSGKLAFTGVAGLVWLIGGGGLLVGAGLALLVPAHRRRNRMRAAATPE